MNKWNGAIPTNCDICNKKLNKYFVDGIIGAKNFKKVKCLATGPWGILCLSCAEKFGAGIGIGQGQLYARVNGEWICIAGGSKDLIEEEICIKCEQPQTRCKCYE